jgi:pimeloyl-ACP methyl ester carboxylesterase
VPDPRLIDVSVPRHPDGVVLVLHGGGGQGGPTPVSPTQPSVLRMIPVARRIARAGHGQLAVLRLLNSSRALKQLASRFGPATPVCVVGHSLGGRAALLSAGGPQVHGVVALAPWVYPDDVATGVAGTPIVIIHGDQDQVAPPERSRRLAQALRRQTQVAYVTVTGGKHAMLSRFAQFDGLAHCVAWMLLGDRRDPIVGRIADGEHDLTV